VATLNCGFSSEFGVYAVRRGLWKNVTTGRMTTMKIWQDFTGNQGAATTTWNRSPTRGWVTSKGYESANA
jgi:hypothetical protein